MFARDFMLALEVPNAVDLYGYMFHGLKDDVIDSSRQPTHGRVYDSPGVLSHDCPATARSHQDVWLRDQSQPNTPYHPHQNHPGLYKILHMFFIVCISKY